MGRRDLNEERVWCPGCGDPEDRWDWKGVVDIDGTFYCSQKCYEDAMGALFPKCRACGARLPSSAATVCNPSCATKAAIQTALKEEDDSRGTAERN